MDLYSRKIVGWQVYEEESSEWAADIVRDITQREGITLKQITLHADNGGPMKGASMLATLQALGIMPSSSRPALGNDNPYSESLFKTLKYDPEYPAQPFADLTEARQWVSGFVDWYNFESAQCDLVRHPSTTSCRSGYRDPGKTTGTLPGGEGTTSGTLVSANQKLATGAGGVSESQ